jgi:hypothetical protein
MKIKDCQIGKVVEDNTRIGNNIGHIIGFSRNSSKELIVDVQMARGLNRDSYNRVSIHPANLTEVV